MKIAVFLPNWIGDVVMATPAVSDGLLIFRHDANDELALPPLRTLDRREYGGMALEFLARK